MKCVLVPKLKSASEKVRQGHSAAEEYYQLPIVAYRRSLQFTVRGRLNGCSTEVADSHLACKAGRAVPIRAFCAVVMSLHWLPAVWNQAGQVGTKMILMSIK